MSATEEAPGRVLPPLDGRDISRIRTEVRLALLALVGLQAEEEGGQTSTNPDTLRAMQGAEADLENALEHLGEALAVLNEEA
jgi:hypothetical protein